MATFNQMFIVEMLFSFVLISMVLAKPSAEKKPIIVPDMGNDLDDQGQIDDGAMVIAFEELPSKHYRPGQLAQIFGAKSEKPMASNLPLFMEGPMRMEKKWSRFEPSIRFY